MLFSMNIAVIVTEEGYPDRVAHGLLTKVLDDFTSKIPQSAYEGTSVSDIATALPLTAI
jgi:hypothetical protein